MKFHTLYSGTKNDVVSEAGDEYKIEYKLVIDDDGIERIEPCGQTNLKAEIQSHAASVDLNIIISRYMQGDETALERAQAFYADVSALPKTMIEIMNLNKEGMAIFDSMKPEVRELFDNNYLNFVDNPEKLKDYLSSLEQKSDVEVVKQSDVEVKEEVVVDEQ